MARINERLEYNFSESIILGCIKEKTLEHTFTEYITPIVLHEFYHLTVLPHHIKVNHTIVQNVDELHTNITKRFDETGDEWCVKALGIAEKVCVRIGMRV